MFITELTLQNFKGFQGSHTFTFKGGLIFLVGENNTGKTTVLEGINFLKSGSDKKPLEDIRNKQALETDIVLVNVKLQGQLTQLITDFADVKILPYIFVENGKETLVLQRSSEVKTIRQNNRDVNLDIKKITIWHPTNNQFENPTGIDTVISTIFETQFIWSDTHPDDVTDFGTTKICGKLLSSIMENFQESDKWKNFAIAHRDTFHGEDSLSTKANQVERDIETIFKAQYGDVSIKFDFSLPEAKAFFSSTSITVNDGTETSLKDKGSGMQRSMALAILQVYAKSLSKHKDDDTKYKPLFFFIDEPEISLHPKAQNILLKSLINISNEQQIFITTHSPYILKNFDSAKHDIFVFKKNSTIIEIIPSTSFALFKWSPSWGEINHLAYNLYTEDFHNELYGALQEQESAYYVAKMETFLEGKGIVKSKSWVRVRDGKPEAPHNATLMTFIRNTIHHPENRKNLNYSDAELRESIEAMKLLIVP